MSQPLLRACIDLRVIHSSGKAPRLTPAHFIAEQSLSFWVQFSFVFGGVVRVLIFCIGQLVIWVGRHAKAQKLALDDFTKIKFGKFILPKVDYWSLGQ